MSADLAALRCIWQQAFGDTEETLDAFFATGFSWDRCNFLCQDGIPVSALYWFDCTLDGQRLAYIYAVATKKAHRGKGLAHRLMADTHAILQERGYAGAVLVPGNEKLFAFYRQLGYRTASTVTEFTAQRSDTPAFIKEIDTAQYARLRRAYLPENSIIQEGAALEFLHTQVRFYAGDDFLLAAAKADDTLLVQELLGNVRAAPGILCALDVPRGRFRTPGNDRDFAMLLPFHQSCPELAYFGLALD